MLTDGVGSYLKAGKEVFFSLKGKYFNKDQAKIHAFVIVVVLLLAVAFITKLQLFLTLLAFHYAFDLVIKYDNRIIQVIGYFREKKRKRKELEMAKNIHDRSFQDKQWNEQIGKKRN